MNCDQVFFALTGGPFPSGAAGDAEVMRHIQHCASCSEVAEALRPAADVFQESLPPAEARDLPGYWVDRPAPSVVIEGIAHETRRSLRVARGGGAAGALATQPRLADTSMAYAAAEERWVWRDMSSVAAFLVLLTAAAFGLGWFFG